MERVQKPAENAPGALHEHEVDAGRLLLTSLGKVLLEESIV